MALRSRMTSEIIVPQLHRDSQRLTPAIARRALDEAQRLESTLLREHRRYRLDSAVVADATGRARVRHTMSDDRASCELAEAAREARAQRVALAPAMMSPSPPRAMLARAEHARLVERLAWLHPVLLGVLDRDDTLAVVAAGPSCEAAGALVESIVRRRAALAQVRAVLAGEAERAWALVEVVEAELEQISLPPAVRRAAVLRSREAARTAQGVVLARTWAIGGATAR